MRVKVKDKRTGIERTVTQKAYAALGPKVYDKLGFVNDDGTEVGVQELPNSSQPQVTRSVRGAAPVVVKSQLVAPTPEPTETITEEQPQEVTAEPAPVKRKPGRQPGSKNKSISSNSTADEK